MDEGLNGLHREPNKRHGKKEDKEFGIITGQK
jgi:hypothetical protein